RSSNAPVLAVIMLCLCAQPFGIIPFVVPDPTLTLLLFALVQACGLVAMLLLIRLSSRFVTRGTLRWVLECLAYVAVVLNFGAYVATYYGIFTLNVDPVSFSWLDSTGAAFSQIPPAALIVVLAAVAVARTPRSERTSAAWLLLPLPIASAVAI